MVSLLTPEIEALIGTERAYTAPEPLGRAAIRYFALAIGDTNPLYTDPDAAAAAGYDDVIAPPTLILETNQFSDRPRDDEGYIGHSWDISIPGTRLIRGGNEYEFGRPAHPSDQITVTWRITDIRERTTSKGVPMVIVASVATYTTETGEVLARNTETVIHQRVPTDG